MHNTKRDPGSVESGAVLSPAGPGRAQRRFLCGARHVGGLALRWSIGGKQPFSITGCGKSRIGGDIVRKREGNGTVNALNRSIDRWHSVSVFVATTVNKIWSTNPGQIVEKQ